MKQLESMKDQLVRVIQEEMENIRGADTKELGEAIDMVKDLSEAIYYCTITEAMHNDKKEEYHKYRRDMDKSNGKMYYSEDMVEWDMGRDYHNISEDKDHREGRSPMSRRAYIEAKEHHHGKEVLMKELENYMQELTQDMAEMIKGASMEEKQLLQKKISTLASKIEQVNV